MAENNGTEILDIESEKIKSLKTITHVIYGLYASSLLFVLPFFIAIVINYVKKGDASGTFIESHFKWQIRTFWFSLLWFVIGIASALIFIGYLIIFANFIWFIYRIVKGWLRLTENKPMYA